MQIHDFTSESFPFLLSFQFRKEYMTLGNRIHFQGNRPIEPPPCLIDCQENPHIFAAFGVDREQAPATIVEVCCVNCCDPTALFMVGRWLRKWENVAKGIGLTNGILSSLSVDAERDQHRASHQLLLWRAAIRDKSQMPELQWQHVATA